MLQTVGWQIANQTHNAAVNYANRNATNPADPTNVALGFASAIGMSAGIGLGLAQAIKRSAMSLAAKTTVRHPISLTGVRPAFARRGWEKKKERKKKERRKGLLAIDFATRGQRKRRKKEGGKKKKKKKGWQSIVHR